MLGSNSAVNGCHYGIVGDRMYGKPLARRKNGWHGCCYSIHCIVDAYDRTDADFIYERKD